MESVSSTVTVPGVDPEELVSESSSGAWKRVIQDVLTRKVKRQRIG